MNALDRLSRLTPDLASTLRRFPVPAAVSFLVCIYANLDAENLVHDGWSPSRPLYAAGAAAFLAAGAADYFAAGLGWTRARATPLSLIAAILCAALVYGVATTHAMPLYFIAGLVLLLMIAGFLHRDASQASLWFFNLRLGLAALLAVIVGLVFGAGLSAIVESLRFLFELDLPSELHEHIWATALSLVGPIYGLSLSPRSLGEEVDLTGDGATLIERGVSILVNYVLVPIIIVYAVILHAYAVKIAIDGVLPKGQIGSMVTVYALGGTAAWIIAWPWRGKGTRLLRWFMQGWFWLTLIPTLLLLLAVWRRVVDYGVTPDRYGLALIAVWLAVVAAHLALRRNRADMRLILGSLAILLLIGSIGPWGAYGLSISSQLGRLTMILTKAGVLAGGKLADPLPKISEEGRGEALSILHVLREAEGLERLKPWFAGRKDDPFAAKSRDWDLFTKITAALEVSDWPKFDYVTFTANRPLDRGITASGRLIGPIRVAQSSTPAQQIVTAVADPSTLTVKMGDRQWSYPVRALMDQAKQSSARVDAEPIVVEAASDVSLVFVAASGEAGEAPKLRSAEIWLILRQ